MWRLAIHVTDHHYRLLFFFWVEGQISNFQCTIAETKSLSMSTYVVGTNVACSRLARLREDKPLFHTCIKL